MSDVDKHTKRKAPWSTKLFEEGDEENYKQVRVKELFGILVSKETALKKTVVREDEGNRITGFKNETS
jgi:hypothetical protein